MGLGVVICVGWDILVSLWSLVIHPFPSGPPALAPTPQPSLGLWGTFHCAPVSGPLDHLLQAPLDMCVHDTFVLQPGIWDLLRSHHGQSAHLHTSGRFGFCPNTMGLAVPSLGHFLGFCPGNGLETASPLGGPSLSRNVITPSGAAQGIGRRGLFALCFPDADVLRGSGLPACPALTRPLPPPLLHRWLLTEANKVDGVEIH